MQMPNLEMSQQLLTAIPCGVATFDSAGKLTWCNNALAEMVGKNVQELEGLQDKELSTQGAGDLVQLTGRACWAQRQSMVLPAGGRAVFFQDVTERQALAQQLQQHNTTDQVSGLLNQLAIAKGLDPLVSRSRRYDNPLSVVTMAIANLAELRKAQGDAAANGVVVGVSQLLRDQLRWADLVGRLDNGDFILVLPETDKHAAEMLADKIAKQLDGCVMEGVQPQACFGVAQWGRGDDAKLLIRGANEALEQAMAKGPFSIVAAK